MVNHSHLTDKEEAKLLMEKIEAGIKQSDAEKVVSTIEAKKRLNKWLD